MEGDGAVALTLEELEAARDAASALSREDRVRLTELIRRAVSGDEGGAVGEEGSAGTAGVRKDG